jgi:hypothetical protein
VEVSGSAYDDGVGRKNVWSTSYGESIGNGEAAFHGHIHRIIIVEKTWNTDLRTSEGMI